MKSLLYCLFIPGSLLLMASASPATSKTIGPGETWSLTEDLVLAGVDVLEVKGSAEKRCSITGNGHSIKTKEKWTGRVLLTHCDCRGLGTASKSALQLAATGTGDKIVIESTTFDACGPVQLSNADTSVTVFRNNIIRETALVPVTNLPSESPAGFRASGNSTARKRFQGNRVYKSVVLFEGARNWLIGGDTDSASNILIGVRASLSIHGGSDMTIRGNYIHTEIPSFRWSQVHNLSVGSPSPNFVAEHNIFRHGQWVIRGITGQFRYNLVLDADAHNWIIGPKEGTHIHHNIFARYCTIDPNLNAGIGVIYKGDDIQIYNNTFDGGGKDLARVWHAPAIEVGSEAFLTSLRNNVFFDFPTKWHTGTATIRPGFFEKKTAPAPARLGYADYNLFWNPDAAEKVNYALTVKGKTERVDAGFGKHDVPAEPKLVGPVPKKFPFTDEDIKAGKVAVSKILAAYRAAFTPAEGSPLINGGDPADGAGAYIGAVGAGKNAPNDWFGRFGGQPGKQ